MTRRVRNTSKTLALLAVALLPLQQVFASTCCCRPDSIAQRTGNETTTCCSNRQVHCCSDNSSGSRTCCQDNRTDHNNESCRCLVCGLSQDSISNVDTGTSEKSCSVEGMSTAISSSCVSTSCGIGRTPLVSTQRSPSLGAADRCTVLCRYRLGDSDMPSSD